jgi:GT2 family glycosyltransferase
MPTPNVCVVIPAYGCHDLTDRVIEDLISDSNRPDVCVVDNAGDYENSSPTVEIVVPGTNIGWARGCNYAISCTWHRPYEAYVLLNNDVRLSVDFVTGLWEAARRCKGQLIGPLYNHNWPHQRRNYFGPADKYLGNPRETQVPFIDGTCMFIQRSAIEIAGVLDEAYWPRHGWGCDKDYALRVRSAGGTVWVTEQSYLNHIGRQTASRLPGYSEHEAEEENDCGMEVKWGQMWRDRLYEGFPDVPRLGTVQERLAER